MPLEARYAKYAELDVNDSPHGFATPSRKVELYSQTFLEHGYAPLPEFDEPRIGPVARPDLAAARAGPHTRGDPGAFGGCRGPERAIADGGYPIAVILEQQAETESSSFHDLYA